LKSAILMRLDLGRPFPKPHWPDGVTLAPFTPADAPAVHALMQSAYARGGGAVSASFEQWWNSTSGDPEFDPALCLVARADDGTIVGFALCWTSSYVKDLVVHPDRRRRGLGKALLLAAAAVLKARGNTQVGLMVEADNPSGARQLYERLGFVIG
jgi:ribosomal protein S18 acetylase RimI-like enzyme